MTARTEHTPGPWQYDAGKKYMPNEVVRFNGCVVAARGRDASEADMRLIASAPALLECGDTLTSEVADAVKHGFDAEHLLRLVNASRQMDAAIAQARGEK